MSNGDDARAEALICQFKRREKTIVVEESPPHSLTPSSTPAQRDEI